MSKEKIDILVAEKVMGCKLISSRTREPFPLDSCGCEGILHSDEDDHFIGRSGGYLKRYSTDINAAMEVLERIQRRATTKTIGCVQLIAPKSNLSCCSKSS